MSDSVRTAFNRLEDASQQHEAGIVVDLGVDRFIQWVGVYLLLALAVIVRVAEAIETSITCYPEDPLGKVNQQLISYATAFCWEAWTGGNFTPTNLTHSVNLIKDKTWLMYFITNLPYMLFFQAFLFSIPWMLWHFAYGSRLTGHLKFVQLLLADIFKELQETNGYVFCDANKDSYDEYSEYLEGSRVKEPGKNSYKENLMCKRQPESAAETRSRKRGQRSQDEEDETSLIHNKTEDKVGVEDERKGKSSNQNNAGAQTARIEEQGKRNNHAASSGGSNQPADQADGSYRPDLDQKKRLSGCTGRRFTIQGEMEDRHLFSMLCFENFASLHHLPYILSMFKLSQAPNGDDGNGTFVLKLEGILKIWSNKKNFSGVKIVKRYIWKQIGTGFFALLSLGVMVFWIAEVGPDLFSGSVTFRCELPSSDICMLCTFLRTRDFLAVLIVDVILTFSLMAISFGHWLFVRGSSDKARCEFFVHMSSISNIALKAAHKMKEKHEKKS